MHTYRNIKSARLTLTHRRFSHARVRLDDDLRLSLYKILFHFKGLLWESIILLLPPLHLQRLPYYNSIARPLGNIRPSTDPPFLCHTPYNIGDGNIV